NWVRNPNSPFGSGGGGMRKVSSLFVLGLSSPCPPTPITRAAAFFRERGISVAYSCDPSQQYQRSDYLFSCAPIPDRVRALTELLAGDVAADLVLSLRGGFGAL